MLRGLNFYVVSSWDLLEDFNCVSDKIRFVIQKVYFGSSLVGGMESGYFGDGQIYWEVMIIIQGRENVGSGWKNKQI